MAAAAAAAAAAAGAAGAARVYPEDGPAPQRVYRGNRGRGQGVYKAARKVPLSEEKTKAMTAHAISSTTAAVVAEVLAGDPYALPVGRRFKTGRVDADLAVSLAANRESRAITRGNSKYNTKPTKRRLMAK